MTINQLPATAMAEIEARRSVAEDDTNTNVQPVAAATANESVEEDEQRNSETVEAQQNQQRQLQETASQTSAQRETRMQEVTERLEQLQQQREEASRARLEQNDTRAQVAIDEREARQRLRQQTIEEIERERAELQKETAEETERSAPPQFVASANTVTDNTRAPSAPFDSGDTDYDDTQGQNTTTASPQFAELEQEAQRRALLNQSAGSELSSEELASALREELALLRQIDELEAQRAIRLANEEASRGELESLQEEIATQVEQDARQLQNGQPASARLGNIIDELS